MKRDFRKPSPARHAPWPIAIAMAPLTFLIAMAAVCLVALRWAKTRRQRRLREASRLRRAERDKRWEEMTGQVVSDDWRP